MKRKNNLFKEVPQARPKRNLFDLSHEVKMSAKFGRLYPVLLMDTLPGDVVRDQMTLFCRMAPMLAPILHMIDVSTHFFFVPNRLLTDVWEEFITGGQDGLAEVVLPYVTPDGLDDNQIVGTGTLWDYLGLPPQGGSTLNDEQISALPFRAYAKIWNDYYRDPNLDVELELNTELEGDVSVETFTEILDTPGNTFGMRQRGWEKDYFTAALPWAQRGAQVLMPLSGFGETIQHSVLDGPPSVIDLLGAEVTTGIRGGAAFPGQLSNDAETQSASLVGQKVEFNASNVTINDFRRSLAISKWMENNARGGGRYIEQIESHFGQRVPDFRLQRAEYLGGGKQKVVISEVLSTADTEDIPVGDMAGHGMSVGKSNRFTYRCQEHGWIVGIMSVMPKTSYSQGIDKMWSRTSKYDFGWPELANLGEQEIKSKEIFFDFAPAGAAANQTVFGYIPRYAEYKFRNDRIAGDFRTTLDFWHLGRNFTARPVLDSEFLRMIEDPASGGDEDTFRRIFAVQDGTDYLWMQLFHRLTAKRPLPYFGVPMI